jgi:hypothetical protein
VRALGILLANSSIAPPGREVASLSLPAISVLAALRGVKTKAARTQGAPYAAALLNTQLETVVCANVVGSDFEGSVRFFSVQKLNRIPVSSLLPGVAAID